MAVKSENAESGCSQCQSPPEVSERRVGLYLESSRKPSACDTSSDASWNGSHENLEDLFITDEESENDHASISSPENPAQSPLVRGIEPIPLERLDAVLKVTADQGQAALDQAAIAKMRGWLRDHGVDVAAELHFLTDPYIHAIMTAPKDGR
jgi:hypothetical protein